MNTLRLIQQFSDGSDGNSSSESSGEEFMLNLQAAMEEDEYAGPSTRTFVHRDRVAANEGLMNDYFVEEPKYNAETFRERYRMSKELFFKIVNDIKANCDYFRDTYDASNRKSFTPIQKCTSAIRQLASGNPPDEFDEYLGMSARTSRECLEYFCNMIILLYGKEFLRAPTSHDIAILYEAHEEKHGIPGMIGSIDCTHWDWRNCPTSLRGQFHRGDHQYPTMILEAVASNDLWIWHAYFGTAGSNNDINVLQRSPLLQADIQGKAPRCPFVLNNRTYNGGYYLADGIYPKWPIFVKTILYPSDEKEEKYKKVQESARKDVERTFVC